MRRAVVGWWAKWCGLSRRGDGWFGWLLGGWPAIGKELQLLGIEQRQDVRVIELRGDRDFTQAALGPERRRQLGAEHLQGDSVMDFHPTICRLLGVPGSQVDGRIIPEVAGNSPTVS